LKASFYRHIVGDSWGIARESDRIFHIGHSQISRSLRFSRKNKKYHKPRTFRHDDKELVLLWTVNLSTSICESAARGAQIHVKKQPALSPSIGLLESSTCNKITLRKPLLPVSIFQLCMGADKVTQGYTDYNWSNVPSLQQPGAFL
jgi:hypothetical protein